MAKKKKGFRKFASKEHQPDQGNLEELLPVAEQPENSQPEPFFQGLALEISPEASAPEASVPEAPVPEASAPEAPVPEVPVPEAPAPEAPVPEAPVPEAPVPEVPVPEVPVPEAPAQEVPAQEAPPEAPVPEAPPEKKETKPSKLQQNGFLALNFIYKYLYFIGIQLLRTTRVRRRHLVHMVHALSDSLRQTIKKRGRSLTIAFRQRKREFLSPIADIKDHYEDFRLAFKNARRYDTGVNATYVIKHAAEFFLTRLWRSVKLILNYLAPLAAIFVLVTAANYFLNIQLALRVEYNGADVGYISDESVFTKAEKDMKDRMVLGEVLVADPTEEDASAVTQMEKIAAEETAQQDSIIIPRYTLAVVDSKQDTIIGNLLTRFANLVGVELVHANRISSSDELTNELIRAVGRTSEHPNGFAVEEADGLYIDNVYIGAVSDGKALLNAMNEMKERYRTAEHADADIQFVKKVQLKAGLYPSYSIRELDSIMEILGKEERGQKIYTVVKGDTPLRIAAKNGISFKELKLLNPDVDVSLFPGDELMISQSVPYMGVQVKITSKYEEELEYDISQQVNPDRDIGYTRAVQKGQKGSQQVTAEIIMIDGLEVQRNILNVTRLKDPVNEIIEVGGNRPLKTIPKNSAGKMASGAFAWPTGVQNVGYGWMGYPGHTGTDIVWSGCYGSPIYASADGTVVASGWGGYYGYRVIISHGGGYQTLYAHCSKLYVSVGEQVSQGDTIAAIGRTGNSSGPHLHFEVRINGTPVNAAPFIYN